MEIKGSGQIDAEALNRFHGVHFGDEVESDDLPAAPQPEAEEEATEETTEEATEAEASEEATEAEASEEASKVTWREDVLLRVMEAAGIDVEARDAFVEHAAHFDLDENGYLKKAELEAAANAWNAEADGEEESSEEEVVAEEAPAEEAPAEEAPAEEAPAEDVSTEDKMCQICMTMNPHDATECSACKFAFS
jgi:ribosomal protein L40E